MFSHLHERLPFTPRGYLLLVALPLASVLGLQFFDIVLSLIGLTLLPVLVLLVAVTLRLLFRLKSRLTLNFQGAAFADSVTAGSPTTFAITAHSCSLLPLYSLKLNLTFVEKELETSKMVVHGSNSERIIFEPTISFPHRGIWTAETAYCTVEDALGLTSLSWKHVLSSPARVKVEPCNPGQLHFPLIPTSFRPGDTVSSESRRDGDPLDLKRYHPSDGLGRIVWKVYARSGQLIARQPEKSMTPEGRLCIFVIAEREDDTVCATAVSYASQIEAAGSELFASCLGGQEKATATSAHDLNELLIDTAWHATSEGLLKDVEDFLASISSGQITTTQLILFLSRRLLVQEADFKRILRMAEYLESTGVKPVFFIVPRYEEMLFSRNGRSKISTTASDKLRRWFFSEDEQMVLSINPSAARWEAALLEECSNRNWQVEQRVW